MNWNAIRKTNRARSARKAKREAADHARKARVEAAGGPVKLDELKSATKRTEPPAPGHIHDREVWTFRGRDWRVLGQGGEYFAYPFVAYRQESDLMTGVPLTTAANRWLTAQIKAAGPACGGEDWIEHPENKAVNVGCSGCLLCRSFNP